MKVELALAIIRDRLYDTLWLCLEDSYNMGDHKKAFTAATVYIGTSDGDLYDNHGKDHALGSWMDKFVPLGRFRDDR